MCLGQLKRRLLAEVGCRERKATTVTSKSSFLPEDLERRISRGYYKGIGPGAHYLYVYNGSEAQAED